MDPLFEHFLTAERITKLFSHLSSIRQSRLSELNQISDTFGDPMQLAQFYVEPDCQHINPSDEDEDDPVSVVRSPVLKTVNAFFDREFAVTDDGRNTMMVLSDAGMGKTSLLMMIKLSFVASFWPKQYNCVLMKLGEDTLGYMENISAKNKTILLLDALDEDPQAWNRIKKRLIELIDAGRYFRRVLITCRTQFMPEDEIDPYRRIGRIKVENYVCPAFYLSFFSEYQVSEYLKKGLDNFSLCNRMLRLCYAREKQVFQAFTHLGSEIQNDCTLFCARFTGLENCGVE